LQEATENNAFAFLRAWKKLFGGAYKFLSELGPCGWTQGLFLLKNHQLNKKINHPNHIPTSFAFSRYFLSCRKLSAPEKEITASGCHNYRFAVKNFFDILYVGLRIRKTAIYGVVLTS